MKVAVTRVFAKFINETANIMGFECEASVVHIPDSHYGFFTGNSLFDSMFFGDYDADKRSSRVIKVVYHDDYYACPKYLTTKELQEEFVRHEVRTADGLRKMLRELLEI